MGSSVTVWTKFNTFTLAETIQSAKVDETTKVDLFISYSLRKNKLKNILFPYDIVRIISNYQLYKCFFDIYDPSKFIISNNLSNQIITLVKTKLSHRENVEDSTIISSCPIKNSNSVEIKFLEKIAKWVFFDISIGIVSKYDKKIAYNRNIKDGCFKCRYSIYLTYDLIRLEKDGEFMSQIPKCAKINDIIKMKLENNHLSWLRNNNLLFQVDLSKFIDEMKFYFAISVNNWTNIKRMEIK